MRLWFLISSFVLVGLAAASAAVGIASNMYETEYTLDPKGNVLEAKRIEVCPAVPCPSQSRDYTYDGRGFMTRERLPEIGITGNGDVDYELDAIGQVRRKTDPRWDLRYVYDDGGRLIRVEEESGRIWKDWVWGNRVPYDAAWEERYEYRGKGSVISKVKSQLVLGGDTTGFAFAQEYSYDAFGNRITLEYPRCIAPLHLPEDDPTTCNDGDDVEAPAHVATTIVNRGTPWRVVSDRGPEIQHYFHSNLEISRREYGHHDNLFLAGAVGKDPWSMSRPQSYSYRPEPDGGLYFATGDYTYDGSGNVWKIDTDRYHYDEANRLIKGTVKQYSAGSYEAVKYDFADNVIEVQRDGGPAVPQPISSSNNHYEGNKGYDGAGNTTEILAGSQTLIRMSYDPFGQVQEFWSLSTDLPGQPRDHDYLVESVYGPGDYRVFTTSVNVEPDAGGGIELIRTLHLRDLGGKVLQQHRVGGLAAFQEVSDVFTHETDHLYGPDGRAFAVQANAGLPVKFLAADHLGTVRLITNHMGELVGRHDYYPFGQELYRENQSDDRLHKFTGHERDYSNQTDYMLGRTYLYPKFRFASPDPARDGWNLYAYVGNNPVNYTDPTGKALFVPILAAAWAGAELLLSAADAVEVVDVWTDDSATWGQRAWTTGAAALGAVAPGGGYSKADDLLGLAADASRVSRGTAASLRKLDDIPWGRYCRTGCEDVANRIQATVGGEIHRIEPGLPGARFLGPRGGKRTDWQYHEVVVKDGRVIDALTGPGGLPIDEFKMLWEYADDINFGF